jgi:hypothetical protein
MGSGSSTPKVDYSTAHFDAGEVQRQLSSAATKASEGAWGTAKFIIYGLLFLGVVAGIGYLVYYFLVIRKLESNQQVTLIVDLVQYNGQDYTEAVRSKVVVDSLHLKNGLSEVTGIPIPQPAGSTAQPNSSIDAIVYHFSNESSKTTGPIHSINEEIDINLGNKEAFSNKKLTTPLKSSPTMFTKLGSMFNMSGHSGDQLPYAKDATSLSTVPSGSAPLSDGSDGAYGMQFWMYIKDWNTNFGKEKHVLSRSDVTNNLIMNPSITLHPTENTMKISVSVFPSGDSSKSEPAPFGHSGATDDVFICEVPDIPLQTWVSVSLTLFSRNLDVYINGKLVKSCLLSGVPKKALGDIIMNKDGGFSGYICGFYHYPRMLVPSDAQAFFSAGTSCSATTAPSALTANTGYGIKFGLYDATGKIVNQYVF